MSMETQAPANKPKRFRPPKPRTTPLKRGQACLNCRHLKIRCDGVRPVCGNCTRVPKDDPCIYTNSFPSTPPLGQEYWHGHGEPELEGIPGPSAWQGYWQQAPTGFNPDSSPPASIFSEFSSGTPESEHSFRDLLDAQEPHAETIRVLLDHFIPNAVQLGFFLHLERFKQAALQPPTAYQHSARPSLALLYAVYLWGAHLSLVNSLVELKPEFLRRALHFISTAETHITPIEDNALHSLQTIQAHVLISKYFLVHKRLLVAQVHASNAATLVLGYRLHKLGSPSAMTLQSRTLFEDISLRPAQNPVEQGERIRCFWSVTSLQVELNLALASGDSGNACILDSAGSEITTPWPMQMVEYELMQGEEEIGGGGGDSPLLRLKPLFYFIAPCALLANGPPISTWHRREFSAYMTSYTDLDLRINALRTSLESTSTIPGYSLADTELTHTYLLIAAASITVNRTSPVDLGARTKCVGAARGILGYLVASPSTPPAIDSVQETLTLVGNADAMYAPMCALACRVLIGEIQNLRMLRGSEWAVAGEDESLLGVDVQNGLLILASYAMTSPLADHYLEEIQREYNALYGMI
ncbi:hypothetical protein FB45DRAFT_1060415 [Roridomyces roridus]|uniref:Zn(2)-C6 fungal-type domain-containing protein n=1 Tax=Roridomyces roridus TaxID=1738132 RepID=A0AAD7BN94_9AGAR|nr:hypothetical protein FB45DRAFT_1060415 [Roridomyces roridus]